MLWKPTHPQIPGCPVREWSQSISEYLLLEGNGDRKSAAALCNFPRAFDRPLYDSMLCQMALWHDPAGLLVVCS